jgi:hypothetical protein
MATNERFLSAKYHFNTLVIMLRPMTRQRRDADNLRTDRDGFVKQTAVSVFSLTIKLPLPQWLRIIWCFCKKSI